MGEIQIIKRCAVALNRQPHILHRLHFIKNTQPPRVVPLLKWGLLPDGDLLLWQNRINSKTLRQWLATPAPANERQTMALQVLKLSTLWSSCGFVHGDLNLDNLLILGSGTLTAIDWILDLQSYEGTPSFAHPLVYKGQHTLETDRHALKILAQLI